MGIIIYLMLLSHRGRIKMGECWRAVVGYEGLYEVSDLGNVKSLDRVVVDSAGRNRRFKGQALKPSLRRRDSRRSVNLKSAGVGSKRTIASLVCEAFIGPRPCGMYVLHREDDLSNDWLSQLYYGTPKQNSEDCARTGRERYVRNELHGMCTISNETIEEIIRLSPHHFQREIADHFGISQGHVSEILSGKRRGTAKSPKHMG